MFEPGGVSGSRRSVGRKNARFPFDPLLFDSIKLDAYATSHKGLPVNISGGKFQFQRRPADVRKRYILGSPEICSKLELLAIGRQFDAMRGVGPDNSLSDFLEIVSPRYWERIQGLAFRCHMRVAPVPIRCRCNNIAIQAAVNATTAFGQHDSARYSSAAGSGSLQSAVFECVDPRSRHIVQDALRSADELQQTAILLSLFPKHARQTCFGDAIPSPAYPPRCSGRDASVPAVHSLSRACICRTKTWLTLVCENKNTHRG